MRAPGVHGGKPIGKPYTVSWNTWLTRDTATLPRLLSQAGYFTGHVGKWHLGFDTAKSTWQEPEIPRDADLTDPEVDDKLRKRQKIHQEKIKEVGGFDYAGSVLTGNHGELRVSALNTHNFEWYAKGAIDFFEEAKRREQPFMLYMASTALHGPDHRGEFKSDPLFTAGGRMDKLPQGYPSRESVQQRATAAPGGLTYESAGLTFLDDHVGYLMQKLKDMGLDDNTIVYFSADHGREPAKATCYEQGARVPMLMRWPGHIPKNFLCERPIQNIDVLPTLLEAAGVSKVPRVDGVSFLPAVQGKHEHARKPIYCEFGMARSIKVGDFKYIAWRYKEEQLQQMKSGAVDVALDPMGLTRQGHFQIAMQYYPGFFAEDQLYNLAEDPNEQNNLAADPAYADKIAEMQKHLKKVLETFRHPYNLAQQPYRQTDAYAALVKARKAEPLPVWWRYDFEFSEPASKGAASGSSCCQKP